MNEGKFFVTDIRKEYREKSGHFCLREEKPVLENRRAMEKERIME
jgi:hypothetical protein